MELWSAFQMENRPHGSTMFDGVWSTDRSYFHARFVTKKARLGHARRDHISGIPAGALQPPILSIYLASQRRLS
jgi:hypothetical protein